MHTPREPIDTRGAFASLELIHDDLVELFTLHQELLLSLDRGRDLARRLLSAFREGLALHMGHEEEFLLPLFDTLDVRRRWSSKVYRAEHDKMRGLLDGIVRDMAAVDATAPAWRRRLLAFIEREATFKHFLEHHDHAESVDLFRILDAHSDPERAAPVVDRCWSDWTALRERVRPLVLEVRAVLGSSDYQA